MEDDLPNALKQRMNIVMEHLAMGVDAALAQTNGERMGFLIVSFPLLNPKQNIFSISNSDNGVLKELFLNLIARWDQGQGVVKLN